ncbi:MAG: hypothetical protein J6X44_04810, partial [Thermoguttaceae bacterium]|nr:hypothetical protein [Thermoguttaceae bacterium]
MTKSLLNQEQRICLKRGKRLFLLVASFVLLLFLVHPFLILFKPVDEDSLITTVFFISRDGVVFDLTKFDPSTIRTAVTNSFDGFHLLAVPELKRVVLPTGSFVTEVKRDKDAVMGKTSNDRFLRFDSLVSTPYVTSYFLETRNVVTQEVISSEPLFQSEKGASFHCALSENKLLFESWSNSNSRQFWEFKENDQWNQIPIDFGLGENVEVLGFEVVREKESIFFVLYL